MLGNIFFEIGIIIVVATLFGFIAKMLRQPLIPAYVLAGLLIGPVFSLVSNQSIISTLSEMGIAFLLFIVGLELNFKKLKSVGFMSAIGGTVQCLIVFVISFALVSMLGFATLEASYIGIILAFSSTMVVIKILSDRKELDTLHGRIIIGILLMQDFIAILALSVLGNIDGFNLALLIAAIGKVFVLCSTAWLANKLVYPWFFKHSASIPELLFLGAVTVCFLFSFLSVWVLGFSVSIGAFIAGISLANLPYNFEIISRVKSIRDFFSTIFFASLGMSILPITQEQIWLLILLFVIVTIIKPIAILCITAFFGYKKRIAFLSGISLGQTSEFSLIIATQGLLLGHVSESIFSISVILAVLTMMGTSYMIKYEYHVYSILKGMLSRFDNFSVNSKYELVKNHKYDVLLVGYDRIGYSIVKKLHIMKKKLLVIDYNPEVIKKLISEGIHCIYGDISDHEILERVNLGKTSMVICTSPDKVANSVLIKKSREQNRNIVIFTTAYTVEDALELYEEGADYVILPHFLSGEHASILIEKFGNDSGKLTRHKINHIAELRSRHKLGHLHPQHHNETRLHG